MHTKNSTPPETKSFWVLSDRRSGEFSSDEGGVDLVCPRWPKVKHLGETLQERYPPVTVNRTRHLGYRDPIAFHEAAQRPSRRSQTRCVTTGIVQKDIDQWVFGKNMNTTHAKPGQNQPKQQVFCRPPMQFGALYNHMFLGNHQKHMEVSHSPSHFLCQGFQAGAILGSNQTCFCLALGLPGRDDKSKGPVPRHSELVINTCWASFEILSSQTDWCDS